MSTRQRLPSKSTEDVSERHREFIRNAAWWCERGDLLLFVFQAAAPLMRYLEQELGYMNENLVQENFNRCETGKEKTAFLFLFLKCSRAKSKCLMW